MEIFGKLLATTVLEQGNVKNQTRNTDFYILQTLNKSINLFGNNKCVKTTNIYFSILVNSPLRRTKSF